MSVVHLLSDTDVGSCLMFLSVARLQTTGDSISYRSHLLYRLRRRFTLVSIPPSSDKELEDGILTFIKWVNELKVLFKDRLWSVDVTEEIRPKES